MSDNLVRQDILRTVAVARRADALFKAMASDFLLREQFITDPSQVFAEYVHGKSIAPEIASTGNYLLFSFMSNVRLVRWIRGYIAKQWRSPPSQQQFATDFSRAIIEYRADDIVVTLIRCAVEGKGLAELRQQFPLFDLLTMVFGGGSVPPKGTAGGGYPFNTEAGVTAATFSGGPGVTAITRGPTEPATAETSVATDTSVTRQTFMTEAVFTDIYVTDPIITAATFMTDLVDGGRSTDTGTTTQTTDTGTTTQTTDTGTTTQTTDTGTTTQTTDTGTTTQTTDTGSTTQTTDTGSTDDGLNIGGRATLGDFGSSHWAVTLFALAQYSTQLRNKGALGNPFRDQPFP